MKQLEYLFDENISNALPERIIFYLDKFLTGKTQLKEEDLPKLFVITEKKIRERSIQ